MPRLFRYIGKQRYDSGLFDSRGQGALMLRACAGNPPGKYLSPFGDKTAQRIRVFVVNFQFLDAEFADFFLKKSLAAFSATAAPVVAVPPVNLIHSPVSPVGPVAVCIFIV
jgi:hypothetical protein